MNITTDLRLDLADLYAGYAACIDAGQFDRWPDFFTEDCHYRVVPRENFDQGLRLSTIDLHGRAMLKDRVYGVQSTLFHAPYYQRHIIGPARLLGREDDFLDVEANYLVIRTKRDAPSELFNTGQYLDRVCITAGGMKFHRKFCVFDSELIPNSLIYPI